MQQLAVKPCTWNTLVEVAGLVLQHHCHAEVDAVPSAPRYVEDV